MPPSFWTAPYDQTACSIIHGLLARTLQERFPRTREAAASARALLSPHLVTLVPRNLKALLCIVPFTQAPRISLVAQHNCSLPRSCTRRAYARISSPAEILTIYSLHNGFSHQHRRRQCQRSILSLQDAEAAGSGELPRASSS